MQSFLNGTECGPSNPLKQVAQREGADNSLFKDRLAPQSSTRLNAFRSSPSFGPQSQAPVARHVNPTPHPFNLSHLSAALAESSRSDSASPVPTASKVPLGPNFEVRWNDAMADRLQPPPSITQAAFRTPVQWASPPSQGSNWIEGYEKWQSSQGKGKQRDIEPGAQMAPNPSYYGGIPGASIGLSQGMGLGYQPSFSPIYGQNLQQPPASLPPEVHLDPQQMEALFDRAEEDWKATDAASSQTSEQVDAKGKGKEKEMPADEETAGETTTDNVEEMKEAKGDFEKVWESLKPEAERLNKLAEWERDFSQFTNDEDDLFDVLNESLNGPSVGQANLDQQTDFLQDERFAMGQGLAPRDDGVPQMAGSSSQHLSSLSASYLWTEANHLLASGGSLSEAAIMIEQFITRSTLQERTQINVSLTEAWATLGRVHAMDEKEEKALEAFQEGSKTLEQEGVTGKESVAGEMLTNLAISYVNESLDLAALSTLHRFLSLTHPAYAGPAPTTSSPLLTSPAASPWVLHQQMADSFLALAREQYQKGEKVDPDVQVGLGTLFYMMGEYDQARDCWVAALKERPEDYLLWNRLGATLANGGSSEEAVDAYRRALELKPGFTRAISNLGVACLNIGVHREAAEHFLAALSLHPSQTDGNSQQISNDSASLWGTLRKSLIAMELADLAAKARPGTDLEVFRRAGFEF
ncbi:peroxisome targeting signal receptor [Cryptococcus bacillisporus CA1873]|uniref:Peroxisome targeting signal receptor n=1 Tax=Cryptococcus bacillisporus CA1873 TaxID=1296111 RepID=A0ABR5BBT7_CRYGA|nr:peroxisome targeting signal receptor [Cryptococcus bacillisporus CA1873]|eukprot:KIR63778.1 peroxisome targeting signal receptor [Cryptococcus gattii CA1873]